VPKTRNGRQMASRNVARDQAVVADGLIGRFVDRACDNPAMTGGLFVMALTATAIVSNAMFLQNVRHPQPLFATRPPLVVDRSVPPPPPIPPHRDDTGSIAPPLPRPAPIAAPTEEPSGDAIVRGIQTALAEKGLYLGAIDGEYGPLSQSAIVAYQKAQGLSVTGEPSAALLEHLRTSSATARPPIEAVSKPQSETEPPALPAVEATMADSQRLRYERVQAALNRIGYGPVAIDGTANEATTNAIRRFELDNGLPISGAVSDAVIDRLLAIGALPAT